MKSIQKQDQSVYWAFVFILVTFLFHVVSTQPQVYFKASLPAKSLPRIGRRSDVDPFPSSMDSWNDLYGSYYTGSYNARPIPEQVLLWKKLLGEMNNQDDSANSYGSGRDIFRPREQGLSK